MTILRNGELQLIIQSPNPEEKRNCLVKALAATMRWKAHYKEQFNGDEENMTEISELIEGLCSLQN